MSKPNTYIRFREPTLNELATMVADKCSTACSIDAARLHVLNWRELYYFMLMETQIFYSPRPESGSRFNVGKAKRLELEKAPKFDDLNKMMLGNSKMIPLFFVLTVEEAELLRQTDPTWADITARYPLPKEAPAPTPTPTADPTPPSVPPPDDDDRRFRFNVLRAVRT